MYRVLLVIVGIEYSGIDATLPLLQTLHFTTIASYGLFVAALLRTSMRDVFAFTQSRLLLVLLLMAMASMTWAVVGSVAFSQFRAFADYTVLFMLSATLVNTRERFFGLVKVLCVVTIYLAIVNAATLVEIATSGSRTSYFRAPYFMGDGNDFSWAMVVVLPLAFALARSSSRLLWRIVGALAACACISVIIGCSSRGAALGLLGTAVFYIVFLSKRRLAGSVALGAALAALLAVAPGTYSSRVKSIGDYQQDNSAQGRLQAWRAATQMAVDWPLGVGAGNFSRAYGRFYIPDDNHNALTNRPNRWIAPHSIYFQTLAEHGFPGLLLLLSILYKNMRALLSARRQAQNGTFTPAGPTALLLGLIGFSICGIFLGGLTYPHLYLLSGMAVGLQRALREEDTQGAAVGSNRAPPASMRTPTMASGSSRVVG